MEINGIPLHPLVVHAVVVLTPTAGLLAILFGLVPRWRWLTRWPMLLAALGGAGVTYVAKISGKDLEKRLNLDTVLFHRHEMWANRLMLAMGVLAVVAILAWYVLPFRTPLAKGSDREARVAVLALPLVVLLPIVGVVVMVLVVLTGDAGAQMVWQGTPG